MPDRTVLIIEDNPTVAQAVAEQLADLGLAHERAVDGADGLRRALDGDYDLVVLDLGLPQLGGAEVCRQLRQAKPRQPIIVLTGQHEEIHAVLLLELGADDYLRKPLSALEFRARVRAVLRRVETFQQPAGADQNQTITCGELSIDLLARRVNVSGVEVLLTPIEFDLLATFCRNPEKTFDREQLVLEIWGYASAAYEQNVRAHISRLRTKLSEAGAKQDYVVTQRGHGYRLADLP